MSPGVAIAIAGAGCVLVFAGIAWLVIWLNRSNAAAEKAALGRLQEEAARRGWTFAERDDRYVDVYHAQVQLTERNPLQPLTPLPRASAARDVVTGTHRGRPFLAASFTVHHRHEQITQRCIWVRTPAPRPPLTVRRVGRAQRTVDAALGQYPSIGDPAFDERFEVSTGDERFARAVLNPRMTNFLLNEDRQFRGFALLGDQLEVLDPVSDHRDPAELIPALDLRCDILDLIPADVWK